MPTDDYPVLRVLILASAFHLAGSALLGADESRDHTV